MRVKGEFVFKSLNERDGGEFVNDKGQKIKYDSKYLLKVDERTEDGIFDRVFSVNKENTELINQIRQCPSYSDVEIEFDVKMYNSQVKLVPISFEVIS